MPITENSDFDHRFNMVMQETERAQLQALADDVGLKESALIRRWIAEAYERRFGKRKPPAVRPKYNSAAGIEAKAKTRKR